MAPDYLHQLMSVLPPSKCDFRGDHDFGILLASPKVRTKITVGKPSSIYDAVYFQSKFD